MKTLSTKKKTNKKTRATQQMRGVRRASSAASSRRRRVLAANAAQWQWLGWARLWSAARDAANTAAKRLWRA